ncbi:MAG: penicillin acylase family protein [Myxococcota bacterium]
MNHRLVALSMFLVACAPINEPEASGPAVTRDAGSDASSARVTVRRDQYGVPHIEAATDEAAMYGLGWATAQDRRFQMHLSTLSTQGRLAEFFGSEYVADDKAARLQMAWTAAEKKASGLDANTLTLLQAYADGVNAYTDSHGLTPSFTREGLKPQKWTVAHSIAAWHELVRKFSVNAFGEARRLHQFEDDVAALGSEEKATQKWLDNIHPGVPSAGVVQLADVDRSYVTAVNRYAESVGITIDDKRTLVPSHADEAPAFSHAFAVNGDRTKSGKSILVADPQLPVLLPAVWYEFQLSSPSFSSRGVGVPGSPGIAIGFNDGVAWGITAGGGEQADLFRLTPGTAKNSYVVDGIEKVMKVRTETIKIGKDGKISGSESVTIRESDFGPDVTPLVADADGEVFALRSVIFGESDRDTIQGMLGMMQAKDLDELKGSLDDWRSPAVNFIAADEDDVYYSVIGGIPVRSQNALFGGNIAQEGDSKDNDWIETIPHEYLPQVTSPASGAVFSGNHRAAGDWYPLPLSLPKNTGGHSNRSARLRDNIASVEEWDTSSFVRNVQNDCVDHNRMRTAQLAAKLYDIAPTSFSKEASKVILFLEDWSAHGSMEVGSGDPYVAANVLTSFRSGEAGTRLTEKYFSGEGGMTYFLDNMEANFDADPKYAPPRDVFEYIDTIFADAYPALRYTEDQRIQAWSEQGELELNLYTTFSGADLNWGYTLGTEPLQCHWKSTIWSQSAQSYSQFVDFDGTSGSMKPPGNAEERSHTSHLAELDLWYDGHFKPAPLTKKAIATIAVSSETEVLSYKGSGL